MSFVHTLWQLYLTAGIIMWPSARGGAALSTGSAVVARWFQTHRGTAIGFCRRRHVRRPAHHHPARQLDRPRSGLARERLWLGLGLLVVVLPLAAWLVRNTPRGARRAARTAPSGWR